MCNTSPNTTFKKLRSLSVSCVGYLGDGIEITKVAAICPHLHKLKILGPLVLDLLESSQIFHNLNKLTLKYSDFVEDPMPHLAKLPSLRVLHLKSALGINKIVFPKNSFPGLQSLVLKGESDLKEWIIEEGALARLGFLQLHSCDNLKTLPEGLSFIDSFQALQIGAMPTEFTKWIVDSDFANIVQLRWDNDISAYMRQEIVLKVNMNCQKCRNKALKVAAATKGVNSLAIVGAKRDEVVVIGTGVDVVKLTISLRKKVGQTNIISIREVKAS